VVLCIVTVSGRAETRHVSYRVVGYQQRVIPDTREILKEWVHPCPGHRRPGDGSGGNSHPCRMAMLTFSACYSSCGARGSGIGTGCRMWTWMSRRTLMTRMRTCPGTCHKTHSWSGRRSCGNILSGTWGMERHSSVPSPPRAQHLEAPEKKKTFTLPKVHSTLLGQSPSPGELGCGNLCPSLPGAATAPEMLLHLAPNNGVKREQTDTRHSL